MSDSPSTEFLVKPSVGSAIARPRTFLNIVLDTSYSMARVRQETIDAVNAFLDGQRSDRVDELVVTLTQFSDLRKVKVCYTAKPIAEVKPLSHKTYIPDGNTALYDAVARTLVAMERQVGTQARVLTVVLTDGEDNASREVQSAEALRRIIEQYQRLGNWTFVFMAAGVSAYQYGAAMGFPSGNVSAYNAAHVGTALATVARGVTSYRHGDAMQTTAFYTGSRKFRRTQWQQGSNEEGAGE